MFENKFYYRVFNLGKRNENIKAANLFFRNYPAKVIEMEKASEEECLQRAIEWLEDASCLELSAEGFEWHLLQETYHYAGRLFGQISRVEDALYCREKEFQCGVGLLALYHEPKDERRAFEKQVSLGRSLIKCFQEKEAWDKAVYYTNSVMDYLISAKGFISEEEIDSLYREVLKDRQEIFEKMKK